MPRASRPRGLTLLLLFFLWVDARTLGTLIFPERSAGHPFYTGLGVGWLHFVLGAVTVALAVTATGFLWRPAAAWFGASMLALGVYAVHLVATTALMVRYPELTRAAVIASREARGLPVRADALGAVIRPGALWTSTFVLLALLGGAALIAWRHRHLPVADADIAPWAT